MLLYFTESLWIELDLIAMVLCMSVFPQTYKQLLDTKWMRQLVNSNA